MSSAEQIIDITANPATLRRRRRAILRIMAEVEHKTRLSDRRATAERFAGGVLAEFRRSRRFT